VRLTGRKSATFSPMGSVLELGTILGLDLAAVTRCGGGGAGAGPGGVERGGCFAQETTVGSTLWTGVEEARGGALNTPSC